MWRGFIMLGQKQAATAGMARECASLTKLYEVLDLKQRIEAQQAVVKEYEGLLREATASQQQEIVEAIRFDAITETDSTIQSRLLELVERYRR